MITYLPACPDYPKHYQDEDTKVRYIRLLGGLGWPTQDDQGIAVVIGEVLNSSPPKYEILAALQDYNARELLSKAKALEIAYPVKTWHGNPKDLAMIQLLYEFNKGKYPEDKLKFQGAPLAGEAKNSGYYLPMVIKMGKVGAERLAVKDTGDAGRIVLLALSGIQPEHLNRDIGLLPALAAVCYPLSYMETYKAAVRKSQPVDQGKKYGSDSWQVI